MTCIKYDAPAANALLDVLEFMTANPVSWGPTELARRLEQSSNMTFRVLNVLTERGYVEKNENGNYHLTAALFSLGMKMQHNFDLRSQARPHLEELAALCGESAQLQIPDGDRMLQVDHVPPPTPYYLVVTPGCRVHWHGNAFGKAVWAFLPREQQEKLFTLPREQLTIHTITDEKLLRKELSDIRISLCAAEYEEYLEGCYCLAAPVFNTLGEIVAAVGISGVISRLKKENLPELQKQVSVCAGKISRSIGFKG
jgi:DNA-binding IclR family transcriptional regulator